MHGSRKSPAICFRSSSSVSSGRPRRQPDLGQTILTTVVWGGMFFMAGMPWLWIIVLASVAIGGFFAAYSILPHVAGRIDRFLTGEGDTFQVDTAREAIIRGDWFGRGPARAW